MTYYLDDIADWLVARPSMATFVVGTNLFVGRMHDSPNNAIALIGYEGSAPFETLGGARVPEIENPRFQVSVRQSSFIAARDWSDTILRELCLVVNLTIASKVWQRVMPQGNPALLGYDDKYLTTFVTNYAVQKTF